MQDNVVIKRLADNSDTTLGVWYINGVGMCGNIEDQEQKGDKVMHETRISEGTYWLGIRDEGGYNEKYKVKYPEMHEGMLCIYNEPDWRIKCPDGKEFQYALVHTGNTDDHTSACLLPNYVLDFANFKGSRSGDAYKEIYPILVNMIKKSPEKRIPITFVDIEEGK